MNSIVNQMYTPIAHGGRIHIENEVILPDYCPDVAKVVKADIVPRVTSKNIYSDDSGLNIAADGTVLFKVIYLAEGSPKLYSTFFTENFSHTFKVQADKSSDFENVFAYINLTPENVSCRPCASRRMTIKCDISVCPEIRLNRPVEYFTEDESECELLTQKLSLCSMCGMNEADYNVSEKIILPRELPPVGEITDCDIRYVTESLKIANCKAVFNATAYFTCFYDSPEGSISFCQPIELSQIIDVPDAEDGTDGELRFTPTSLRADTDVDNYGENRVITLDFSYTAHAVVFTNREFDAAADVFSPTREITAETGDCNLRRYCQSVYEKVQIPASLRLKNPDITSFEDIRPTAYIRGWVAENGVLTADCRMNIKMIGSYDGGFDGIEENIDFSVHTKLNDIPSPQCDLSIAVREVDCVPSGSSIEVRADAVLTGSIFSQSSARFVKTLSVGEKKKDECRPPIILYYPSERETLWEIAKKYSLSQSSLRDFNGMESDKITEKVLKIPMK
ncbi:MAG: hypothetical protein E7588_03610 [Ruminococcaceae bacterium]|nr:hypothetical protein [Oscillospiraceae bacterium]